MGQRQLAAARGERIRRSTACGQGSCARSGSWGHRSKLSIRAMAVRTTLMSAQSMGPKRGDALGDHRDGSGKVGNSALPVLQDIGESNEPGPLRPLGGGHIRRNEEGLHRTDGPSL